MIRRTLRAGMLPMLLLASMLLPAPALLHAQVGNGIPFVPTSAEGDGSQTFLLDMRDPTIYDRSYDRFMPGINWGKHPTRRQNDALGFSVYDGYVIPSWASDPLVAHLPDDTRLIAVNAEPTMNMLQLLTWGYGTRTDPELAIDTETGFGVLRAGDKTGAIRTCRRHPDVTVQDSIITLAPTLTPAGTPTTVLWENQNADVLHFQQLIGNAESADYSDYNGDIIDVTILVRVPTVPTGLTAAQAREPVLTLRLKGGLVWCAGPAALLNGTAEDDEKAYTSASGRVVFTKPGKERHKEILALREEGYDFADPNSRPFTVGTDGSVTRMTADGPFAMPYNEVIDLWFSSVPRPATASETTAVTSFPTTRPPGWAATVIKGREWALMHGRTAADEATGRAEEDLLVGDDNVLNPAIRTLKQMTITRGMLARLPAGEWVSFTGRVRFQNRGLGPDRKWESERLKNLKSLRKGATKHPMLSFSNPQLKDRKGKPGETQVHGILFELDYHGHHAVDIDWVSFETPQMRRLSKEELRGPIARAVDATEQTVRAGGPLAAPGTHRRILGHRTYEEEKEAIWMSQRYLSALLKGNIITEDDARPSRYWRHHVVSDYSLEGNAPLWWWHDHPPVDGRRTMQTSPSYMRYGLRGATDSDDAVRNAKNNDRERATLGLKGGVEGLIDPEKAATDPTGRDSWSPRRYASGAEKNFSAFVRSLGHHEISSELTRAWASQDTKADHHFFPSLGPTDVGGSILSLLASGRQTPGTGISREAFLRYFLRQDPTILRMQAGGRDAWHDLYGADASRHRAVHHVVDDWNNYDAPFQMKIELERYVDLYAPENRGRLYDGTRWLRMIWADAQVLTDEAAAATSGQDIARYRSIRRYDVRPPLTAEEMRLAIGTTIMVGASGFMVYNGALTLNAQNQNTDEGRVMGGMYTRAHLLGNQTVTTPLMAWNAAEPWAPRALPAASGVPDFSTTEAALNSYLGRTTVTLSGQNVQQSGGDYFFPTAPNGGVTAIGGVDILAFHPLSFYWEASDPSPAIPDGQKGHKMVTGGQASFPASLNALVVKKEPLTPSMDPYGILQTGRLYTGQQSLRRELLFWGQALRGHVPAASASAPPSTETWQERLAGLRLASWYGKGYIDMQSWDEARYGQDDPMDAILDAARVRTRHPYRWVEFTGYDDNGSTRYDGQRTRLMKDYEAWDSSFYDITILRRATPQEVPLGEEFYLCVANRRVTPIIATEGQGSTPHTWAFVAPAEMAAVSGSSATSTLRTRPYAQIGSREITLPFTYVDGDGNAALFRLTEMTTGLTSDDGQATVHSTAIGGRNLAVRPGLDTVVSSTGELAVALLPGEVKIFRVLVSPAVTTPAQFGRLGINTQSKIIAETRTIGTTHEVRYHCVYHTNFDKATNGLFPEGAHHVFYTHTDWLLPDQTAPEAPVVQGGSNGLWKQEQRLDMAVVMDNDATDGTLTNILPTIAAPLTPVHRQKMALDLANAVNPSAPCDRLVWSSAFPSVTLSEATTSKHLHVVYTTRVPCDRAPSCPPLPGYGATNEYGATLHICETRIPLPAAGAVTVQDRTARSQVVIYHKGLNNNDVISEADFAAWGTPVVNAGQKNTYIAWASQEGIGVVAKPYRNAVPVYDLFPRPDNPDPLVADMWRTLKPSAAGYASSHAGPRCPSLNPITHPQSVRDDATLVWQDNGRILYTRLYNDPTVPANLMDDALTNFIDPVQPLCYETVNGTTCAQDPAQIQVYTGADPVLNGKVLLLSAAMEGQATMPSVTRDLDFLPVSEGQLRIVEANGASSPEYWVGTESIAYQVRNPTAGSRSEVIRKHFLELRAGAQRTSPRTLHYWWRSRSFSTSHSLFHPQVVPGLRYQDTMDVASDPPFQIPYRLLWNAAGTSSTVGASMNFRAINRSDTAVWNTYSLLPAATYATLWSTATVGEDPATFLAPSVNDQALVDVIPDRVLVVQNPYRKQTQPYVHSPSVHLTGGWPHLVTVTANTHKWLHQLGRVAVEQPTTPVPGTNTWQVRLSAEPFYKEDDRLETVRVHHGFESADGAASLHGTVRGEELPLQWTQFLDGQDAAAPTGHFSLVSEPFTVMGGLPMTLTLDGAFRDAATVMLEEVDVTGAAVATMTLPVASIPQLPDALVTVEAALVNGQGHRYRLRFDATDATSAVPAESIERFPASGFDGLYKTTPIAMTVDVAARKVYATEAAPETLHVIPNPATEQCVVIVPGSSEPPLYAAQNRPRLRLLTAAGETILDDTVQPASVVTVDVSRLPQGIYAVVLDMAGLGTRRGTIVVVR